MDFTNQYPFAGAAQPYPSFIPMPPLTPSHSQSAASDDFGNTSPPDGFDGLGQAADQFHGFDYAQAFGHHNAAFPSPPTPPNHSAFGHHHQPQQNHAQPSLQTSQPHQHQHNQNHASSVPSRNSSVNGANGMTNPIDASTAPNPEPNGEDATQPRAGSEDEENMTPAQSRRKAQNRAAQRAFRERKEKHVKDLETKLASLEAAQQKASSENERLKRDLQKMSTENEILRATSTTSNSHGSMSSEPATTGPMHYNPTDFYSNVLQNHQNKMPSHRITTSDDGERLLAAGATWDFIISHDLYKRGLVDVGDVSERLKHCARCDGQGPVFSEHVIIAAIEQSVASGSDDLL